MTNNNFEKRIQEKLNQYQVEPSENLLENIFEKRAAKSKGALNFSYFKLGVAMLSLAIITAVIVLNWSPSGNSGELSGTRPDFNYSDNKLADKADMQPSDNKGNSTVSAPEKAKADNNRDNKVEKAIVHKALPVSVRKNIRKEGNASASEKLAKGNNKDEMNNALARKDDKNTQTERAGIKVGANGNEPYNDNGYNIEERYYNVDAKDRPIIAAAYHNGNSHLMVYHSVDKDRLDNVNLNYMLLKPMHAIPSSKTGSEQIALIDYKTIDHVVKSRKPLFIDAMFTPVLSFHNVSGNGVDGHYQAISKSNFNKQYNLRVSYPVSSNINVFAGIGYMNLVTSFKGDYNYSESAVRVETVTRYINDPVLGTIKVVDTMNVNYIKNSSLKCDFRNTYDIVTIPLGLSYNFGVKKFDFGIHGAALFNVYTHANGTNADFVKHQTTNFNSEKKYLGLGGGISFMVAYKLSNKFKLLVEPGLQYFRIDGGKIGNSVNEKVLNNGLNIGLRYTLY